MFFVLIIIFSASFGFLWDRAFKHEGEIGHFIYKIAQKNKITAKLSDCVVCPAGWIAIITHLCYSQPLNMLVFCCILSMMSAYYLDLKL